MRRWNGWGDETVTLDVPQSAVEFIQSKLGKGSLVHDVSMQEAVAMVPPSRLPDHALLNKDTFGRLRHSIGESLPDMIAVRGGTIPGYVDAVAYPTTDGEVRQVLGLAKDTGAAVIPYGGGTSVVGHLDPSGLDRPVISLDMGRHSAMLEFDGKGCLATFGAGIAGPDIEANLRAKGFTLGHYPQSWELSTMGGWVASRSSGQFSPGLRPHRVAVRGRGHGNAPGPFGNAAPSGFGCWAQRQGGRAGQRGPHGRDHPLHGEDIAPARGGRVLRRVFSGPG